MSSISEVLDNTDAALESLAKFKPKREPILSEREKTHGDFKANAHVAQSLKLILRESEKWPLMQDRQKEALDMMATKVARIMVGDPNHKDHWDDIAGYAKLGSEACES